MMADKIKASYKFSKSFYDDAITQGQEKIAYALTLSSSIATQPFKQA